MTGALTVVLKIGGNEIDQPGFLAAMAQATARLRARQRAVIVHGGGKEIADLQKRLGLQPRFLDGLRVTDDDSLAVAEMVLSGRVNKRVVAALLQAGIPAIGLSGVDDGLLRVERMTHPSGDLGWVGQIVEVNPTPLQVLLNAGMTPVVSPISLGRDGHSYNVNADQAALAIARGLGAARLVFVSNVPGVLVDGQCVRALTTEQAEAWIGEGIISGGMIPKVRAALEAAASGVAQAVITDLAGLAGDGGTVFVGAHND